MKYTVGDTGSWSLGHFTGIMYEKPENLEHSLQIPGVQISSYQSIDKYLDDLDE